MGQAKIRKLIDPNYGKPQRIERGLIVTSPSSVLPDGSLYLAKSDLDSQELRSSLLYWDKLAWPKNDLMVVEHEHDDDIMELIRCNVLETPTVPSLRSGMAGRIMAGTQHNALLMLEGRNPGVWSIGEGVNSIVVEGDAEQGGTGMQLYNCLPVPGPDVPLVEILDFKDRHKSELLAFRLHLDETTKAIASSDDSSEALKRAIKDLDDSCADLIAITKEWQFPVTLANWKSSLNLDFAKSISVADKVWRQTEALQLGKTEQAIAALLAGVSSHIKITADFNFNKIKRPSSPYKYLLEATRQLK